MTVSGGTLLSFWDVVMVLNSFLMILSGLLRGLDDTLTVSWECIMNNCGRSLLRAEWSRHAKKLTSLLFGTLLVHIRTVGQGPNCDNKRICRIKIGTKWCLFFILTISLISTVRINKEPPSGADVHMTISLSTVRKNKEAPIIGADLNMTISLISTVRINKEAQADLDMTS